MNAEQRLQVFDGQQFAFVAAQRFLKFRVEFQCLIDGCAHDHRVRTDTGFLANFFLPVFHIADRIATVVAPPAGTGKRHFRTGQVGSGILCDLGILVFAPKINAVFHAFGRTDFRVEHGFRLFTVINRIGKVVFAQNDVDAVHVVRHHDIRFRADGPLGFPETERFLTEFRNRGAFLIHGYDRKQCLADELGVSVTTCDVG